MQIASLAAVQSGTALLSLLSLQWPSAVMLVLAGTMIVAWRLGRPTAQALTTATFAMAMLHMLAWWAYGSANGLHALCAIVGLALILPIVLRSRRAYPLVAGAAVLLAMLALGCAALLSGPGALAAQMIAAMANAVLVLTLWAGIVADWRGQRTGFGTSRPQYLPQ